MKLKFVFIISAVVCALLIVFKWPLVQLQQSAMSPDSGKPKKTAEGRDLLESATSNVPTASQSRSSNQGELPKDLALQEIIQQGYGNGAVRAKDTMESFLKTWNPIGRSAQELKATFGKPSEEKAESITYMFDTGSFGWVFEFVLSEGKVIDLKRAVSE